MPTDPPHHHAYVETWLRTQPDDLTPRGLVVLLERALTALWRGASLMLGEVTLTAIVDRILYCASERYPFVSVTKVGATTSSFEVRLLGAVQNDRRLREVVQYVVAEFITVLGNLTDEILTPLLHDALAEVRSDELERADHEAEELAR